MVESISNAHPKTINRSILVLSCAIGCSLICHFSLFFIFVDFLPVFEKTFDYRWLTIGQNLFTHGVYSRAAVDANGNLVNTSELREELSKDDKRHINTQSDTEVLINIFASDLYFTCKK